MTTLAAGQTVTFTIPAGQVAQVSGSGVAVLLYPLSSPISIINSGVIGPFAFARIVSLQAAAQIDYTVAALPTSNGGSTGLLGLVSRPVVSSPVVAGTSVGATNAVFAGSPAPTTALQWLLDGVAIGGATSIPYASVSGDAGKSLTLRATATNTSGTLTAVSDAVVVGAAPSNLLPLHTLIAQEGDSITAQEIWTMSALGEYGGSQYMYPYQGNQALSGTTTTQQLVAADVNAVIAKNAVVLTLHTGTNDIALSGNTPAQIFANVQSLINQHCANGVCKKYIYIKILPRNDATFTALSGARQADLAATNALMDGLVAPSGVDLRVVTISTFNPTTDTYDGLHPNYIGARKIGAVVGPILASWITQTDLRPLYADASTNLILAAGLNAALTGTGGTKSGVTGSVADNWTGALATDGTLVADCSKVDNGDGSFGQKFTVTGTPATTGRNLSLAKSVTITGAQIGDVYECWCVCTIGNGTGINNVAAKINARGVSLGGTFTLAQDIAPGTFLLRSKLNLAETTAVTSLTVNMTAVFGTGAVNAEITFSKPYMRKVV